MNFIVRLLGRIPAVLGLLCHGFIYAQPAPGSIHEHTIARYRYSVKEYRTTLASSYSSIEDIDVSERDRLKQRFAHFRITEGVDRSFERYLQIENFESTEAEDWLYTPPIQLVTPKGSYGLDENYQPEYFFPITEREIRERQYLTSNRSENGYRPVMASFPDILDEFVDHARSQGARLDKSDDGSFRLKWTDMEINFQPETKTVRSEVSTDDRRIISVTRYRLFSPYGYVVDSEHEEITRTDLEHPVTFVTDRHYSDHVIEDPCSVIPKSNKTAYLFISPVPVRSHYKVIVKGLSDLRVSQVQVRDHSGHIVHTHRSPATSGNVIELDGSTYPSGVLVLLVYTPHGTYTETITKP